MDKTTTKPTIDYKRQKMLKSHSYRKRVKDYIEQFRLYAMWPRNRDENKVSQHEISQIAKYLAEPFEVETRRMREGN